MHYAALIEKKATSGKTVPDFCKENNIHPNTFYYWRKRLKTDDQPSTPVTNFIPLRVSPDDNNTAPIEIEFSDGTVLRLPPYRTEIATIRPLIELLRGK
jgi:transposase-like protein